MFIPQLTGCCLALFCVMTAQADAYKWINDNGETVYSQLPPENRPYKKMVTPPPPAMNPEAAQKEIDQLIEQQKISDAVREDQLQKIQQARQAAAIMKENCKVASYNLQQYQDNPGRRVMNLHRNVTRPTETERQEKISALKEQVNKFCQQED